MASLQARIDELWARRAEIAPRDPDVVSPVHEAIDLLDTGAARVAEIVDDEVGVAT